MALPPQSQVFLQEMMDARCLPAAKAAHLYNSCGEAVAEHSNVRNPRAVAPDGSGLEATMDGINAKLGVSGLALKAVYSPWEKETFWGVVNTVGDGAARLATGGLSVAQLTFFFAMVEEMLESGGEMNLVDVQNCGPEHKLRVNDAGKLIHALQKRGWLQLLRQSGDKVKVVFGARSMLELPNVRAFVLSQTRATGAETGANGVACDQAGRSQ
jgi:phosphotransferase system IIB component